LTEFNYAVEGGYQETEILRQLTTRKKLQPLTINKVLVWHTRTEQPDLISEEKLTLQGSLPSDQGF
jgi:galactosylgalactosylxylosylprotein 3-beta-glucuronosyltransferase 3